MSLGRDLSALLGSRICHDLISPLGAIGNGIELLSMAGLPASPELDLITQSVEHANARIRYFRISFGAAQEGQSIGSTEVTGVLDDVSRNGRVRYDWRPKGDLPRPMVKLSFLLMQCLESAMPRGGRILVDRTTVGWILRADADRFNVDPALWSLVVSPEALAEVTPSDVHFPLVLPAAQAAGRTLMTEIGDDAIVARF
ncbi:MAG: histidine phosphotransferase family protein [Pseudomonadota bacterium]